MLKAFGLSKSRATDEQRVEAGYFQVVRELIVQLTEQGGSSPSGKGVLTLGQVNDLINELLKQNIVHADGVIDLFKVEDEAVSMFDPKFLESLSRMKERNLAYELLKKLIDEQIRGYRKKERDAGEEIFGIDAADGERLFERSADECRSIRGNAQDGSRNAFGKQQGQGYGFDRKEFRVAKERSFNLRRLPTITKAEAVNSLR